MDEQLTKSLSDLIDETLSELEELRKSKMSAAEIKLEGPGEGIAGKPSDGELEAKKAEDSDEEDEDEEDSEAEKSEEPEDEGHGEDDSADKPSTKRKLKAMMEAKKAEDSDEEDEDEEDDKDMEKSSEMAKKEKKEPHKDDKKHEEKEKKLAQKLLDMHKSEDEATTLIKSYVDERIQPIEEKLATLLQLVNAIAEQPVAPKGVTSKTTPLLKSNDSSYEETLSKAELANKLFELKKSGTRVDSLDIAKVEMGQDLVNIVKKYDIS